MCLFDSLHVDYLLSTGNTNPKEVGDTLFEVVKPSILPQATTITTIEEEGPHHPEGVELVSLQLIQ
jgi:hypothetical protein